jgi:SAM-dependent methyltransferase
MTSHGSIEALPVWERVWRHLPGADKDRALLRREEQSTRWVVVRDALMQAFGGIEGLRTIELGAGRGDLSLLLARQGARVTLLDLSQTALTQAHERFSREGLSAECTRDDLFAVRTHGGTFDVSLSLGVIEHFCGPDRLRAVQAHADVLRPGGLAVISVPHAACVPYRLWKAYLELRGWWPYGMEQPYSRRELARLARLSGLVEVRLVGTAFLQSLGDHVCKTFLHRRPAWIDHTCRLDNALGLNLLMLARKARTDDWRKPA